MKKVIGEKKDYGASLIVPRELRNRIRVHCATHSLWIGKFVTTVITDYLDNFEGKNTDKNEQ